MPCADDRSIEAPLHRAAERVTAQLRAQDDAWGTRGWTRRRFLAGVGMAGVASLGTQLVTIRVAFGATTATDRTLIVIFLRGAADGLRIVQPNTSALGLDYLRSVRDSLTLGSTETISLGNGWAMNAALSPLAPLLSSGELAFVAAVSTPDLSRSHFQSQALLERGGVATASDGWLNRVLAQLGPGTTFRALAEGTALPVSLLGAQPSLCVESIKDFTFPSSATVSAAAQKAVSTLYRGMTGTLAEDVPTAMSALATAKTVQSHLAVANGASYPAGDFANALRDIAATLRSEVGLQVATIDVGGWDTHTDEKHDLDTNLSAAAHALNAFMTDLGPTRRKRVTVAVLTEFGRRVQMNASGGTDHGHGSVMWLLGGGLARSGVLGAWTPLSPGVLDNGDVPGLNNPFDVLGELAQKRLGVGSLATVFPGHVYTPLNVATTL